MEGAAKRRKAMKVLLLVMWGLAGAPAPEGSFKMEMADLESCKNAVTLASKLIEAVPTPEGMKFFMACVPPKPAVAPPDRGI